MLDVDCYDLKGCPGECPPGGWEDCEANPEVRRELALGSKRGAAAMVALACFSLCALVGAILWALDHAGVVR